MTETDIKGTGGELKHSISPRDTSVPRAIGGTAILFDDIRTLQEEYQIAAEETVGALNDLPADALITFVLYGKEREPSEEDSGVNFVLGLGPQARCPTYENDSTTRYTFLKGNIVFGFKPREDGDVFAHIIIASNQASLENCEDPQSTAITRLLAGPSVQNDETYLAGPGIDIVVTIPSDPPIRWPEIQLY